MMYIAYHCFRVSEILTLRGERWRWRAREEAGRAPWGDLLHSAPSCFRYPLLPLLPPGRCLHSSFAQGVQHAGCSIRRIFQKILRWEFLTKDFVGVSGLILPHLILPHFPTFWVLEAGHPCEITSLGSRSLRRELWSNDRASSRMRVSESRMTALNVLASMCWMCSSMCSVCF